MNNNKSAKFLMIIKIVLMIIKIVLMIIKMIAMKETSDHPKILS